MRHANHPPPPATHRLHSTSRHLHHDWRLHAVCGKTERLLAANVVLVIPSQFPSLQAVRRPMLEVVHTVRACLHTDHALSLRHSGPAGPDLGNARPFVAGAQNRSVNVFDETEIQSPGKQH